MEIDRYIKEAHDYFVSTGEYVCPECGGLGRIDSEPLEGVGRMIQMTKECPSCGGLKINPNKNIGELLMLIVSELGEALGADRKNHYCHTSTLENYLYGNVGCGGDKNRYFENCIKNSFEDKIADVFIRLFDLCGYLEIDIAPYINISVPSTVDENIGQALFFITAEITEYYRKHESVSGVISLAGAFSRLLNMCHETHLNIPIEKHIEAKIFYMRGKA